MELQTIFQQDSRVEEVFDYAKGKYQEADLCQHNWDHIVGNLYRAFEIAETEDDIDYSILTLSVLFHDIGVTEGDYERHEERSIKIAERELPNFGFEDKEIEQVVHAVETTSEEADSETIEAKINSDADKLVKCGFASVFNFFRVQKELDKNLEEMVSDLSRYRNLKEVGFYTDKAEEIGGNGFEERIEFLEKFREKLKEREDFTAKEYDL